MIAIPIDKPTRCELCPCAYYSEGALSDICQVTDKPITDGKPTDCPLIEIVRCGECKYMRKYALRSDEPTGIWCHRWSVPRLVTDDDFCSYGDRIDEYEKEYRELGLYELRELRKGERRADGDI